MSIFIDTDRLRSTNVESRLAMAAIGLSSAFKGAVILRRVFPDFNGRFVEVTVDVSQTGFPEVSSVRENVIPAERDLS